MSGQGREIAGGYTLTSIAMIGGLPLCERYSIFRNAQEKS